MGHFYNVGLYPLSSIRKIGPRSHVWSEKEVVDKAAWEFEEVSYLLLIQVTPCCGGHCYTACLSHLTLHHLNTKLADYWKVVV